MQSKWNLTSLGLAALIFIAALLSGSSAGAAITLNGTISSAVTGTSGANSLTWSHTVAAGTNRVLFVEFSIAIKSSTVTSITYGGVALTQVGRGAVNHAVEIWRLVNPAVGTANVVISWTGNSAAMGGATTFNGVDQSVPNGSFVSSAGTSTLGSVTVPSAAGEMVIDTQYWDGDASGGNYDPSQTANWFRQYSTTNFGSSTRKAGAAPSVVMRAWVPTSMDWEFGGLSIKPATLAIVKQTWVLNGSAPLVSPVTAPAGATLVFLIYVKNTSAIMVTDIRINDLLDQTGFDYVAGSLVRTLAAAPPADVATDKQIFDATAPAAGTALTDAIDGDVGSAQDTGAPAGVDRITIGAVTGQANAALNINANTTFAIRFLVKVK